MHSRSQNTPGTSCNAEARYFADATVKWPLSSIMLRKVKTIATARPVRILKKRINPLNKTWILIAMVGMMG